MTAWTITPRDPLLTRDGRPNIGRSQSRTLPFPYPSSVAGVVRTRLGTDPDRGFALADRLADLLRVSLKGPLLWDGTDLQFPAPRDVVVFRGQKGFELAPLVPERVHDAVFDDDLPATAEWCLPVMRPLRDEKPATDAPAFWTWDCMRQWLVRPADERCSVDISKGMRTLPRESRVHVALGPTETAVEGMLFSTAGLRFSGTAASQPESDSWRCLSSCALWLEVDTPSAMADRALAPGFGPMAGERRIALWEPSPQGCPDVPEEVANHIESGSSALVRVILATPGIFASGWHPQWLLAAPDGSGLSVKLIAACVGRAETVSGWDLATGRPKPTRRLAPSGSVYWLELSGAAAERRRWLASIWMSNVSDAAQDRTDGFGLALVGVGP